MSLPLLMISDDPRTGLDRLWDAWVADTRGWYTAIEVGAVLLWECPPGWAIEGGRLLRRDARATPVRGDVWTWTRTRALESRGWESVTVEEQAAYVGERELPMSWANHVRGPEGYHVPITVDRWLVNGRPREWWTENRARSIPKRAQLLRHGLGDEPDSRLLGLSVGRVRG